MSCFAVLSVSSVMMTVGVSSRPRPVMMN